MQHALPLLSFLHHSVAARPLKFNNQHMSQTKLYKSAGQLLLDLVEWLTSRGRARDLRHGLLGDRRDDAC